MITAAKYTEDLEALAWSDTSYNNKYPYNLLYCYGNGRFSADCNNLIKALVNGREIANAKAGTFQSASDLPLTGDCTELQLLNKCKNVSSDFTKMGTHPHVLYMSGHVGTYLGYEVEVYGQIYNTVECTAWTGDVGHNGVIYSYVDKGGNRRFHKGGQIKSMWSQHGDMATLVDCSVLSEKVKNDTSTFPIIVGDSVGYVTQWFIESCAKDIVLYRGIEYFPELINHVEAYLNYYGYYNGKIGDADFGYILEAAVRTWQIKSGRTETGKIEYADWVQILKG